jgi:uncharacterized glyoxalase superfamily protein PhnB
MTKIPDHLTRITPYLFYKDCDAAIDFLTNVAGFTEKVRMHDEEGTTNHAELELEDQRVMLGHPGGDYRTPNELGGRTQLVYCYVDDVDAHHERVKSAGADIQREPEDQFYGDRTYAFRDPEGHAWTFATHVREVTPEEMQAATR